MWGYFPVNGCVALTIYIWELVFWFLRTIKPSLVLPLQKSGVSFLPVPCLSLAFWKLQIKGRGFIEVTGSFPDNLSQSKFVASKQKEGIKSTMEPTPARIGVGDPSKKLRYYPYAMPRLNVQELPIIHQFSEYVKKLNKKTGYYC